VTGAASGAAKHSVSAKGSLTFDLDQRSDVIARPPAVTVERWRPPAIGRGSF
jgi:hypothetical protein